MLTNIICDPFDCKYVGMVCSIINQGDLQRIYQVFVPLTVKHGQLEYVTNDTSIHWYHRTIWIWIKVSLDCIGIVWIIFYLSVVSNILLES